MAECKRCETLPETEYQQGHLYLSPPMIPTLDSIERLLKKHSVSYSMEESLLVKANFGSEITPELCTDLYNSLDPLELRDTKALFLPQGEELDVSHFSSIQSMERFLSVCSNKWFISLLREERIVSWFQPIVKSSNPDEVFAYECLVRGLDTAGSLIFPDRLFAAARSADLIFHLDRVCRQSAVKCGALHNIETNLFVNFNPTSIYDPEHCLKSTMETIRQTGFPREKIVFEVIETDQVRDISHLQKIIKYYREKGFRIALDDMGAGYGSLNLLHQIRPDYVKIDLELIRDVHKDPYKGKIVENMLDITNSLGIESIAEGVECRQEWEWLESRGASYIQGYYFARPAEIPPLPKHPDS